MTRPTSPRTTNRIANMRRLIAELAKGDMQRDDIATFLGMAKSTTRDMLDDLTAGEVIAIARRVEIHPGVFGQPVYTFIADSDKVEHCLADIEQHGGRRTRRSDRSPIDIAARTPGRHFHLLADDMVFHVKVCNVVPQHTALHAAFFGRAA